MYWLKTYFPILILLISITACSQNSNPVSSSSQENPEFDSIDFPSIVEFNGNSGTGLLAAYNLIISKDKLNAELIPIRSASVGESYIVSGESYFTTSRCPDCLRIVEVGLENLQGNIELTFMISHPYEKGDPALPPSLDNRLDLDIFDVALIFNPVGFDSSTFPLTDISVVDEVVLEADGYTRELNDMLGGKKALPYIICYERTNSQNRFEMGMKNRDFEVILSGEELQLQLYLTFGYGISAEIGTRLFPTYYVPEFHRKAAWRIWVDPPTWYTYDTVTEFPIEIKVFDWNHDYVVSDNFPDRNNTDHISAPSDIVSVTVEIPGMVDNLVDAVYDGQHTGSPHRPFYYFASIANENGLEGGTYTGLVKVLDSRIPGKSTDGFETDTLLHSPDGGLNFEWYNMPEFATYQVFPVKVVGQPLNPNMTGMFYPWLDFYDVAYLGNYAYASTHAGFKIVDLIDPETPEVVGGIPDFSDMWDIERLAVNDNVACVIVDDFGVPELNLFDISNPENPVFITYLYEYHHVFDIAFKDDLLYILHVNTDLAFSVVDVSRPYDAYTLCSSNIGEIGGYWFKLLDDDHAYFGSGNIVDLSDPCAPEITGHIDTDCSSRSVAVKDNLIYISCRPRDGFIIIDASDPNNPHITGEGPEFRAYNVAVKDDYLYVDTLYFDGLLVFDVSDPSNPLLVNSLMTDSKFKSISVNGDYLYVDADGMLQVFDISSPMAPQPVNAFGRFYKPNCVALTGNYAYVGNGRGVTIFDITDQNNPVFINTIDMGDDTLQIEIIGDYAAVRTWSFHGLKILNISDPLHPIVISDVWVDYPKDMTMHGTIAYVSSSGVRIVDLSNPYFPQITGSFPDIYGGSPQAITTNDDYAYLIANELQVYDISDPLNPQARGMAEYLQSNATDIATYNDYVYITGYLEYLQVFNVNDPDNPFSVSYVQTSMAWSITIDNGYAYVPDKAGLRMIDLSNPAYPMIDNTFDARGHFTHAAIRDNLAYVSDYIGGFAIIELW